jgi:predicted metalloprotease
MRRLLPILSSALVLVLSVGVAGCGEQDAVEEARQRAEQAAQRAERAVGGDEIRRRVEALRADAEQLRARGREAREDFGRRVRQVLEDITKVVPEASLPEPTAQGRTAETEIAAFLTDTLESVDTYWTRTLAESGLAEPRVSYNWVPRGGAERTGCQTVADDRAAFYCPRDDTIYMAEQLASDLYEGIADNFPGERAGAGNAIGDFGLAYVVAHEYAHNVQFELGFYEMADPRQGVKAFELQADCMAGLWGNAVYREGKYDRADVEEAISTAQAAGDFDYGNAQHHGTPSERRDAWLAGFQSGDPGRCQEFVPGT